MVSDIPLVRFTPDNVATLVLLSKTIPGLGISTRAMGEAIIAAVSPEAALWIIMTPPEKGLDGVDAGREALAGSLESKRHLCRETFGVNGRCHCAHQTQRQREMHPVVLHVFGFHL